MTSAARRPARDAVQRVYPLLPLQQGMLFHDLLEMQARPYFRQESFRIQGTDERAGGGFDPALCATVWNVLMARHELLRSVFDYENTSRLLQLILRERTIEFGDEDISGLDVAAQTARITKYRAADRARGFDLRQDPLMRVQVFRLGGQQFEMVWSHPHILLDGWSAGVLLTEFGTIYAAMRADRHADLPAPPPYQAYLDQMAARDSDASRRFWSEQLAGYETLASLPRLGPRRPGIGYQSREHVVSLGAVRHAALTDLAARNGVTVNTVLRALWGIVLGRYNDTNDVVFGSVVSGRTVDVEGIERMVGAFINTIPVRVTVQAGEGVPALLDRLQQAAIESLLHDHIPLAEIQAATRLRAGLLDHLLVFENYPQADANPGPALGFAVTAVDTDERANYDFGVLVQPGPPLRIVFKYDGEVYSERQMCRLGSQVTALIDCIITDPTTPIERLDILSPAEHAELAAFCRGPRVSYPRDETIVGLWRAQVARRSRHLALVAGATRMSYRDLDAHSDRLAAALRRRPDFQAQQVIGMLAGRGWKRIVALLGILKAGGVYLPLSQAFPDERIRFILDDTACRLVLTDDTGQARLDTIRPGVGVVIADDGVPEGGEQSLPDSSPAYDPRNLAYIIFTSGSTGRPKGVLVEHRGFVNMITQQIAGFGITAVDRILQFASCSFDASLSEIFMALLSGGCLVLADDETIRDPGLLLATVANQGVTVAGVSPSFLGALERADFPGLRVLISAGEAVDPGDARHYAARLRFFNAYGPTEASVCASFHEVRPDQPYPAGIPIGRPLANTDIRILDRSGRPVPIGALGEICLSGPGLARGYNNSPELTRQKFVPIPPGSQSWESETPSDLAEEQGRLYRTGDLGFWLEDGNIVFRGRADGQVKVHGRRIETGEIESVLRAFSGIQQAAVVVTHDSGSGPGRLTAYVVAVKDPDRDALRQHLATFLPSYMIPAAVIRLAALPLTIAGKLDRAALPLPQAEGGDVGEHHRAKPETAAEKAVAGAFESVLGCEGVSRDDTFQSLGGDSLTAIRVVGWLRKRGFGLELRDLLDHQSVVAIAAALIPLRVETELGITAPDGTASTTGAIPLTPIQAAFFANHKRDRHHFNHAVLLRAAQRLDESALCASLAAIWQHHDALRLRFQFGADGITQDAADSASVITPVTVDLRAVEQPWPVLMGDVAARQDGFDLERGPLLNAVCYRLPEADFLLLLAHHLVIDAVSWRILLEDVSIGYGQAQDGRKPRLPASSASYLEWARELAAYGGSDISARQRSYWDAIDRMPVRPLATDFPAVPHHYGETCLVTLAVPVADRPLSDGAVQAVLLAALSQALANCDRPGKTRVLLSAHGRFPVPGSTLDVSRTIGWFTAEFPFLLNATAGVPDLAALRHELDQAMRRALDYGVLRMPKPAGQAYDMTVERAAPPRPEIAVNYLGRIDPEPDPLFSVSDALDGVSVGRLERPRVLEVAAQRNAGQLTVALRYCDKIHRPATIEHLATELRAALTVMLDMASHPKSNEGP